MSVDLIVNAMLEGDAGVTGVVADEIWAEARPEGNPLPALVTTLISDVPSPAFASAGSQPWTGRIQIEAQGESLDLAKAAIDAAVAACHLRSGLIGGFHVNASIVENIRSGGYDALVGVYSRLADVKVQYQV